MNTRAERYATNILKYPTKKEARLASGYSPSYATSGHIEKTEAVKKAMSKVIQELELERDRLITAMGADDLSKVQYRDKANALDKIQKQIQLMSGGETERVGLQVMFDKSFDDDSQVSPSEES